MIFRPRMAAGSRASPPPTRRLPRANASGRREASRRSSFVSIAELRQPFLQMIPQHGLSKQIGGRALVVEAGGFLAQIVPLADLAIAAAQPCQRHRVDLLFLMSVLMNAV